MMRSRRTILVVIVIAVGLCVAYEALTLSDRTIRSTEWKFNDDLHGVFPNSDFLFFDDGALLLRNDSIFRADSLLAVVVCAYHKPFAYDRLIIKVISSGRKVEYVAI